MKNILRTIGALLLATALVVSLVPVSDVEASSSASDFQMKGSRLVKYAGTAEVVSIPDDVREIGEEAFAGNSDIVKVVINDKCKKIDYGAFSNCIGLRTVIIGDDVESIGVGAFANDPALTNVTFGESVKDIGSAIFAGDSSLSNLDVSSNPHFVLDNKVLYDNHHEIVYCALPTYDNYEYIMPNSVIEVKGYAFWGNPYITNVSVSSNLYSIPEYVFSNCMNLRQVSIPLQVRSIDSKAFEDCVNLSVVDCPDSLTYISDSAFDGCPNVTISARVGSYPYNYGQTLRKKLIDEVEYEDVELAGLVKEETVSKLPDFKYDELAAVIKGNSSDNTSNNTSSDTVDNISNNTPTTADNISDANENIQTNDDNSLKENPSNTESSNQSKPSNDNEPQVNLAVKYSTGVINGADVVTYTYYDPSKDTTSNLLGSASIVHGSALVFIDNNAKVRNGENNDKFDLEAEVEIINSDNVSNDKSEKSTEDDKSDKNAASDIKSSNEDEVKDNKTTVGQIINSNAKGMTFPKFTLVGDRIASQAYYCDSELKDYVIPDNITTIGDFAFARSGLTKIDIPEGIETIGYGAFYHCEDLAEVNIPSSVKCIKSYAFENTKYMSDYQGDFVIVGDGILIGYKGSDAIVTIPEGVKLVADGAFRDHMGITAVNLPDSLKIIGEDAFNGCKNLKTLNRGDNLETIGANAFKGTALSNVTIHSNVREIGIGAFDLEGGTDTVTFLGDVLPSIISGTAASRITNVSDRDYIFGNMKNAIIPTGVSRLNGTVLEPGQYGFHGVVVDELMNVISDNSNGVYRRNNNSVSVDSNSGMIDSSSVSAKIVSNDGSYVLHINDSQNAKEKISIAYGELYGGRQPENLLGFDFSLMDDSDTINIKKLGKQSVEVTMNPPSGISIENLHIVALDEDGQLENVVYQITEDGKVKMNLTHFSPYGFYNYGGNNTDGIVKTGVHIKDDTPDTGDFDIHPKWFLVVGCVALAVLLFVLSIKKNEILN